MRVDDAFLAALDATVRAEGTTRSAWLKALIGEHIGLEKPARPVPRFGDDDERVKVSVRLNRRELSALEGAAKSLGVRRADMMRKLLRSQLYDGDEFVILSPETMKELVGLKSQIKRIGGMVNRCEMKINSTLKDDSHDELKDHAESLTNMRDNLDGMIDNVAKFISRVCDEEHTYWCGTSWDFEPRKKYERRASEG